MTAQRPPKRRQERERSWREANELPGSGANQLVPRRPHRIEGAAWRSALSAYLSISRVARAHEEQSLRPALDQMAASLAQFDQRFAFLGEASNDKRMDPLRMLDAYQANLRARGFERAAIRAQREQDKRLRSLRKEAARILRRRHLQRQLYRMLELERIEAEAQKLMQERLQRVAALAATPIEDFTAFTLKLEILFAEIFQHDPDHGGLFAELVADVRGLHKARIFEEK